MRRWAAPTITSSLRPTSCSRTLAAGCWWARPLASRSRSAASSTDRPTPRASPPTNRRGRGGPGGGPRARAGQGGAGREPWFADDPDEEGEGAGVADVAVEPGAGEAGLESSLGGQFGRSPGSDPGRLAEPSEQESDAATAVRE